MVRRMWEVGNDDPMISANDCFHHNTTETLEMMLMASSKWKLLRIKMKTQESHFTESTAADTGIYFTITQILIQLWSLTGVTVTLQTSCQNALIVIIYKWFYEKQQGKLNIWNKDFNGQITF